MRSPMWLVALLVFSTTGFAACQADDDARDELTPTTTSIPQPTDRNAAIVDAFVEGLLAAFSDSATEREATCIANSIVGDLGIEEVVRLARDQLDDPTPSTPELQAAVLKAFDLCLTPEQKAELGAN